MLDEEHPFIPNSLTAAEKEFPAQQLLFVCKIFLRPANHSKKPTKEKLVYPFSFDDFFALDSETTTAWLMAKFTKFFALRQLIF